MIKLDGPDKYGVVKATVWDRNVVSTKFQAVNGKLREVGPRTTTGEKCDFSISKRNYKRIIELVGKRLQKILDGQREHPNRPRLL